VSDSKSTPDESDDRGTVATGATAGRDGASSAPNGRASAPDGQGTAERPAEALGTAHGASRSPGAASDGAKAGTGTTDRSAGDAGDTTVDGAPVVGVTQPAPGTGAAPVADAAAPPSGSGPDRSGGDVFTAVDQPTAAVPAVPPARKADPAAATSGPAGAVPPPRPAVTPPPPPARPVPGPGPGAAAPPPWNRVPGQEDRGEAVPVEPDGPTALLADSPTTFMEPGAATPSPGHTPPGPDGVHDTGWSAVRSVRNRPPRQAALQLRRLDPWSVLKLGLVLAVVLFFIWLVAVGVLYGVLDGMGVWDRLNGTYADLVSGEAAPSGSSLISAGRVFALAAVVGAINSLLFAVAVTLGAFVYNVCADVVGGVEVTLSERD
jgi:hypothetical protein